MPRAFLLILLLACLYLHPAGAAGPPPDIVVFLTDDQGRLDCAPYGGGGIPTPNMEALAGRGLTFDRAYVASPSCAPSRAALLTGLMPARNGAESNHEKPRADIRKWPAYFHDLGYEVVAFGKVSHYQHTADYGFDHFAYDGFHQHEAVPAAIRWLEARPKGAARPLCLMVGTNWPHVPWPAETGGIEQDALALPAGSVDTPETRRWRARYAAAVAKADEDLGAVMDAASRHLPGALFVFSADHGAQWPFAKWNLYEAGVAVPLVIAWAGVTGPGTRTAAMVSWVDLLPTLVEAAGGVAPQAIDGRSFLPVLRGQAGSHRDRVFTTHSNDKRMNVYPARALREGRWKYIRNLHPEFAFTTHIDLVAGELGQRAFFATWEAAAQHDPDAAATLQRYHARPPEELYDLETDPAEQNNLAGDPAQAARLAGLRADVDAWMEEQGDEGAVPVEGRLLSDPASYGPGAAVGIGTSAGERP
jgi:arylsulfatase A-like enzyme